MFTVSTRFLSPIGFLLLAGAPMLAAPYNPGEFQEDTQTPQAADLEWPAKEFPDPKPAAKGFQPGERFQFRAQWGIFRKAGQMTITTEALDSENAPQLLVKTDTRSSGFIRTLFPLTLLGETILEPSQGRMLDYRVLGSTRGDQTDVHTRFDYAASLSHHTDKTRPERNAVRSLPYPFPLDYSSAILQIRGWDLAIGSRHPLFISSRGKFYLIDLKTAERTTLDTEFGPMETFRIEPVSAYPQSKIFREGGKMSLWVSADARRIPLRLDVKTSVGTASMRLESFTLSPDSLAAKAP